MSIKCKLVKISLSLFVFLVQVETIGDAYMVVSGVPERSMYHAEHVADMALNMLKSMHQLPDPSNVAEHLKIRIGQFDRETFLRP